MARPLLRPRRRFDFREDWPKLALAVTALGFVWACLPRLPRPAGMCPACGEFVFRVGYGYGAAGTLQSRRLATTEGMKYTVTMKETTDILDGG